MTDQELKELQLKQEIDARFKALESQLTARITALESGFAAQLTRIEALESLAARVDALEKKTAAPQPKK